MTRNTSKKLTAALLTLVLMTSMTMTSLASDCDSESDDSHTHDYTVTTTEATCRTHGYANYFCETCGDSYTEETADPVGHEYSAWVTAGGDTASQHINVCRFCGRTNGEVSDCEDLILYLNDADESYHICMVCGTFGDKTLDRAENAVCKIGGKEVAAEYTAVYETDDPFGYTRPVLDGYSEYGVEVTHAFTVTAVDDGAADDPDAEMRVSVDFSAGSRRNFKLVRMNEDGEWEEIDYTYANRRLSFKTDEAGVFFVVYP